MEQKFEVEITAKKKLFELNVKELWRYRDLILLFVKRNFIAQYKQTVLGPAWAVIQPLLTTVIFTLVFGNIAGLAPSGVPSFIYYLCGNVAWTYFAGCLTATATTFTSNSAILGKVYFPRLVMPVSTVLSQLIAFGIQIVFFLAFWIYYLCVPSGVQPNAYLALFPLLVLQLALLGLGFGIIISACTTKYRDLAMMVGFGTQLWMYATPVAYDVSYIPEKWYAIYMLNPVTPIINTFRYGFMGVGSFDLTYYLIGWGITLLVVCGGVILFNRVEKNFMDTV